MRRLGWTLAAVAVFGLGIAGQRGGWFQTSSPATPPAPPVQSVQYQPSAAERIARKTDLRYLQCQPRHWRYCVIPR
jgi:hypothetical protein